MKLRIFIIGLLALCGLSSTAAENYFRPGTVWTVQSSPDYPPFEDFFSCYFILEEITFEGEKVLPLTACYHTNIEGQEPQAVLERYLRTEGDKVYWRSTQPEYPDWYLLYDFGLQVGDDVTVYSLSSNIDPDNDEHWIEKVVPHTLQCIRSDYYLNDNPLEGPLMRFQVAGTTGEYYQGDWIIGMGYFSGSGNLLDSGIYGWEGGGTTTVCVESPKGNVVFGELPAAGIGEFTDNPESAVHGGVYNFQGARVADSTNNLPAGLYIVDGKKVVVK